MDEEINPQFRDGFLKQLRALKLNDKGNFAGRQKPMYKGIRVGPDLLRKVDDLIEDQWQQSGKTLWL